MKEGDQVSRPIPHQLDKQRQVPESHAFWSLQNGFQVIQCPTCLLLLQEHSKVAQRFLTNQRRRLVLLRLDQGKFKNILTREPNLTKRIINLCLSLKLVQHQRGPPRRFQFVVVIRVGYDLDQLICQRTIIIGEKESERKTRKQIVDQNHYQCIVAKLKTLSHVMK